VKASLADTWRKTGLRSPSQKHYEFKMAHGFCKFFKTQAQRGIATSEDVEVLMGHRMPYYKPTLEHLEKEYLKALPYLTISESMQLKHEIQEQEKQHKTDFQEMRIELLEAKERQRRKDEVLRRVVDRLGRLEEQIRGSPPP
jgi:hypothetical protein